jgi:hypothetical protein
VASRCSRPCPTASPTSSTRWPPNTWRGRGQSRWRREAHVYVDEQVDDRRERSAAAFGETKEALGGYLTFDAQDLDAAIELAARIPAAWMGGAIEVRPLVERWSRGDPAPENRLDGSW